VQLQAEAKYRMKPEDLGKVYVRSATSNADDSAGGVSTVKHIVGPEQVERFNGFVAAKVLGDSKPGRQFGRRHQDRRRAWPPRPAARLRNRLDRPGLPGKAHRLARCRPSASPSSWSS
jgi:multidrug efflux pump subunit AcrB